MSFGVLALLVVLVGLAFAGSRQELASGATVAGVDVGGLTRRDAIAELERRFAAVRADPLTFVAGTHEFEFAANQLAVEPDWSGAVAAAAHAGDGFGPLRGYRRLHTRLFGAEVAPRLAVSSAALEFAVDRISDEVDRAPANAALVRRGLRIVVVPGREGRRLDRVAAEGVIVRALGGLGRTPREVILPVATTSPRVSAAMLAPVARRARTALSAPVTLRGEARSWRLSRTRIAELLSLPKEGRTRLAVGGPGAEAYFRQLSRRVGRAPVDAGFDVSGGTVQIVPSRPGFELDVPATARAILRAALRPEDRVATASVVRALPERTTREALAMGIDRRMSIYKTYNSGTSDRITNLRLGVQALDDTLVAPGGTFSLNGAIGERTAERGFRMAPVIIGTEYKEEIGGGTSQVATTAFNAAWEAGLKITERHPHSLYISRYPLGRDATVYWPSLDLEFVNDTERWILVKGFVESDGISIGIYGGETRRVESSATPLEVTGPVPRKNVKDPKLERGKTVVEDAGAPPTRTTATREVYADDGTLVRRETWSTSYDAEERIVRVGTKPPPDEPGPRGRQQRPPGGERPIPPTTPR